MTDEEVAKLISTIQLKSAYYGGDETWGKVLQFIEELQIKNDSSRKWISVEEKLPAMNKEHPHECDVLVYVPKREGIYQHGIRIGARGKVAGDPKGKDNFWGIPTQDCDWDIRGWSYFEHPVVTHWMPLPKAPIAEEEKKI